ncbi:MAG: biotin/lipoyl-binding carrier protein, partial [Candidatus Nanopelagicales bacterium]
MEIRAEMVAQVHSVLIEVGTEVAVGDTLVILESMKMEIPVFVEQAGTVREIAVAAGDVIQEGDLIAVIGLSPRPHMTDHRSYI